MTARYRTRIRALHRQLGIPADYSAQRHLPLQPEATRLVSVGPAADDGQPVRLTPGAAAAWKKMCAAAARDRVELLPLSGFRSVTRQAQIIREKIADGQSLKNILRRVAAPGCSEHHTGRALDLGAPNHFKLDVDFAQTETFRWLNEHAAEFAFQLSYPRLNPYGIVHEPWHWCWRR